jgi:pimeloyl-ACP methyl ester carboxylesterase
MTTHTRPVQIRAGAALIDGDLAIQAPTLLIVGGADDVVIELNRQAMRRMRTYVELEILPGATHLFEEPGALEEVSRLAVAGCRRYLSKARP